MLLVGFGHWVAYHELKFVIFFFRGARFIFELFDKFVKFLAKFRPFVDFGLSSENQVFFVGDGTFLLGDFVHNIVAVMFIQNLDVQNAL